MRDCVNQEEAAAHFVAGLRMDVTHLLPSISTPTLVLQPSDSPLAPIAWGRELASSIPGAQLKVLKTSVGWSDEIGEWIIASIRDFVAVMPQGSKGQTTERRFQTILFTDIVDSTPLMHALGDARWRELLSGHERVTREILARHAGAEIKTIGDSFMVRLALLRGQRNARLICNGRSRRETRASRRPRCTCASASTPASRSPIATTSSEQR